jgi:hypothetical protein
MSQAKGGSFKRKNQQNIIGFFFNSENFIL